MMRKNGGITTKLIWNNLFITHSIYLAVAGDNSHSKTFLPQLEIFSTMKLIIPTAVAGFRHYINLSQ